MPSAKTSATSRDLYKGGIDLLDLRQRQPDLIPVQCRASQLQRVAFEIHSLKFLLVLEFLLNLFEGGQSIAGCPELLQMCEMGQIGEMVDLIVRNVEDTELGVGVEARYRGQGVVGNIELLEVKKIGRAHV